MWNEDPSHSLPPWWFCCCLLPSLRISWIIRKRKKIISWFLDEIGLNSASSMYSKIGDTAKWNNQCSKQIALMSRQVWRWSGDRKRNANYFPLLLQLKSCMLVECRRRRGRGGRRGNPLNNSQEAKLESLKDPPWKTQKGLGDPRGRSRGIPELWVGEGDALKVLLHTSQEEGQELEIWKVWEMGL